MKYRFRTRPYAHQKAALRQLLKQQYGGALLMEPRTGKTKTAIDWLSILAQAGKLDRAVIICPARVMTTWLEEVHTHCPARVHVTVWDADARASGLQPPPQGYDLSLLIVNYEAFATPGRTLKSGRRSKASGRYKHRQLILKWMQGKPAACIVDESHKIKSPSGKASNMIVSLQRSFPYRLILTGTPITKAKRAFDIYMQWNFLNPARFSHLPTFADFKNEYGRWTNKNGYPQFVGPRNIKDLHARIAKDAVIVRRDECFDLPPREDIVRFVELGTRTRKLYTELAEEMIAEIEEGVYGEASIKLVQNLRLAQLTSGFLTDTEGTMHRVGFEKLEAFQSILEDAVEEDQRLVAVARWKADLDAIEEAGRALDIPVYSIRGGVKRQDADAGRRAFQERDEASLMVLQPAAASLGIDLSTASTMVWFSHTPSWVDYSQACDRIALSRNSTTFYHLVARRSVDEVLLDVLHQDGDVGKAILTHPRELLNGHKLPLDRLNRLKGVGIL